MMNIGQAAKFSGVSAKSIRYYEQIGLVPKVSRSDAGYRNYGTQDVQNLRFIRRARDLGFSVRQISELLVLWGDPDRGCIDVKAMALSHVAGLKAKIADLQAMAQTLEQLAEQCHGNDRPDCPIIAGLAQRTAAVAQFHRHGGLIPASRRDADAFVSAGKAHIHSSEQLQEFHMLRFFIPNMTCGGCARSVTRVLLGVDPQAQIKTDPPTRVVVIDSTLDAHTLLTVLSDAGYPGEHLPQAISS